MENGGVGTQNGVNAHDREKERKITVNNLQSK